MLQNNNNTCHTSHNSSQPQPTTATHHTTAITVNNNQHHIHIHHNTMTNLLRMMNWQQWVYLYLFSFMISFIFVIVFSLNSYNYSNKCQWHIMTTSTNIVSTACPLSAINWGQLQTMGIQQIKAQEMDSVTWATDITGKSFFSFSLHFSFY